MKNVLRDFQKGIHSVKDPIHHELIWDRSHVLLLVYYQGDISKGLNFFLKLYRTG